MTILVLFILVIVGTSIWMGLDAQAIGYYQPKYNGSGLNPLWTKEKKQEPPVAWFIGGFLLWIVVFPWYLSKRPGLKIIASTNKMGGGENANPLQLELRRDWPEYYSQRDVAEIIGRSKRP